MLDQRKNNYRNHSNVQFNDNYCNNAQSQNNYRSQSHVGRMMTDQAQHNVHSQSVLTYNNKITHINKNFTIEPTVFPEYQKNNIHYQQFFCKTKKFIKPYTQCTKYADNLIKNRQLLRRGQFDLPIQPIPLQAFGKTMYSNKTSNSFNTTNYKNKTLLKKTAQTIEAIHKKVSRDQKNGFDRTLSQQFNNFTTLLNEERKTQKEKIKFKNSMNRLLAAQMINHRLMSAGHSLRPTQSVRVGSLHK